jgi:hypothetical protein
MFDLITNMVKNESQLAELQQTTESSLADLRLRSRTLLTTMVATLAAAIIAAGAAIAAAFVKGTH